MSTTTTIAPVAVDDRVNAAEKSAGVTVSGTAEAGSQVTVTWGSTTKTVTATGGGTWSASFASGEIPADGSTTIKATATDAAGNKSAERTHSVTIDTAALTTAVVKKVGTQDNDYLRDDPGSYILAGGFGADVISLVEDGKYTPFSRDVVRIGPGESSHWAVTKPNRYDYKFDVITGFDITSRTVSDHDVLDLPSAVIAGNANGFDNGTDVGGIRSHRIENGIVTFGSSDSGSALTISKGNVADALEYLRTNLKAPGTTVAFRVDTDNNGTVDSLVVFQDAGTLPLRGNLEVPDLVVLLKNLAGVESATLGNSAGKNVVEIQDTQLPKLPAFALASNGITFNFSEKVFVPSQVSSLALTMSKNGFTDTMSPIRVTGDGTPALTIEYNTTLHPTDWATFVYKGTSASNAFRDAANNVVDEAAVYVAGGSGNNTIDISAYPYRTEINISGHGGDDRIIGHKGVDKISGGAGADTLTGGRGNDHFIFEQGDSPAVTGLKLRFGYLDDGATFSFAYGVDRITDFTSGDRIELTRPNPDLFGNDVRYMGRAPSKGLATNQGYFVVRGDYDESEKTFTVNEKAGRSTLIVWDGNPTDGETQTGIVLDNVIPSELSLGHGWIGHL